MDKGKSTPRGRFTAVLYTAAGLSVFRALCHASHIIALLSLDVKHCGQEESTTINYLDTLAGSTTAAPDLSSYVVPAALLGVMICLSAGMIYTLRCGADRRGTVCCAAACTAMALIPATASFPVLMYHGLPKVLPAAGVFAAYLTTAVVLFARHTRRNLLLCVLAVLVVLWLLTFFIAGNTVYSVLDVAAIVLSSGCMALVEKQKQELTNEQ